MKHSPALALAVALTSVAAPGEAISRFFVQGSATGYLRAPIPDAGGLQVDADKSGLESLSGNHFSQHPSPSPEPRAAPRPAAGAAQSPLPVCVPAAPMDEITVKRINIIDPTTGQVQMVMAGGLPGPVVRGRQMERSIAPAGIIWHDGNGDESGGLVTAPVAAWKGAPGGKSAWSRSITRTRSPTPSVWAPLNPVTGNDGKAG